MKTKLSSRFWVALTLFSLVGQVAWVVENMYFNVFIYKMFRASAADISAMVGASSVAATVTTVLIGALSDRIGKRKLLICGGYLVWGVSILSFCLLRVDVIEAIFPMTANAMSLGVSLVIIMDCVMTFFGSSANDAAFNAWVTDSTDHTNRGAVEGINSMMPLISILVVFGGFMGFDLNQSESWTWIFAIIGSVVICVGIAGLFLIDESKIEPTKTGYFENYVLIMAPAIILAAVVTAFWGKVYDKRGFKFAALAALAALNLGYIVLYLTRSTLPVFLGSLLMMSGYLSGMAVFGAYVRDFTPEGKSGQFQGLRIFSQVLIPGVIGPAIGAAVLSGAEQIVNSDGTTSFVPNANIFAAALAVGVVVTVCVLAVKSGRRSVAD